MIQGSMQVLRTLEHLNSDSAHNLLKDIDDKNIKSLYCEVVEMKRHYKRAYAHLNEEMNKRTSENISRGDSEHLSALDKENVADVEDLS